MLGIRKCDLYGNTQNTAVKKKVEEEAVFSAVEVSKSQAQTAEGCAPRQAPSWAP